MSAEYLPGRDALRNYPFLETVMPADEALDHLTGRTKVAVRKNLWTSSVGDSVPDRNLSPHRTALQYIDAIIERVVRPGGMALTEDNLIRVYTLPQIRPMTFQQISGLITHGLGLKINDPHQTDTLNQSREHVGSFLDLLHLIKPDVASFDNGVAIIAENLRMHHVNPSVMGFMIEDVFADWEAESQKLFPNPDSLRTDYDRVELFKKAYLNQAWPGERKDFHRGELRQRG